MKKDLFGDLTAENDEFSQKYKQRNNEFELQETIKSIDELIIVMSDDEKNLEWAKFILSLYDKHKNNKEIFSGLKYKQLFENLREDAEAIFNEHQAQLEKERQEKERQALLEQERFVQEEFLKKELLEKQKQEKENSNKKTANEIDEEIGQLMLADRDKLWCKAVENLYEKVERLKFEQRRYCTKLEDLEDLRDEIKLVYKASLIDGKISKLASEMPRDERWCMRVSNLRDGEFESVSKYLENLKLYNELVLEIEEVKNQLKEEAERIAKQEELEHKKQLEREAFELYQQIQAEENEKNEKREKLVTGILRLENDETHPFAYKVENDKIVLDHAKKKDFKTFEIPYGVEVINESAFAFQKKLKSVTIPETVEDLRGKVFWGCESLQEIKIPESVKEIKSNSFEGCIKLQKVVANGVTHIEKEAFSGCKSLTTLEMKCLEYFDKPAFSGCINLKTVKSNSLTIRDKVIASIPQNKAYMKYLDSLIKSVK